MSFIYISVHSLCQPYPCVLRPDCNVISCVCLGLFLCSIFSHSTAYQHNVAERNSDMQRIALNLGVFEDGPPLKGPGNSLLLIKKKLPSY